MCHVLIYHMLFFLVVLLHFFQQLQLNYTHTVYTNLLFIIVLYFVHMFYYTHVISCHEIFCVI